MRGKGGREARIEGLVKEEMKDVGQEGLRELVKEEMRKEVQKLNKKRNDGG